LFLPAATALPTLQGRAAAAVARHILQHKAKNPTTTEDGRNATSRGSIISRRFLGTEKNKMKWKSHAPPLFDQLIFYFSLEIKN